MALNSINTNIAAYFAQNNISKANQMSATSIGRLSSGERIVNASDDVAGLAAGTSLQTTVTTLRAALTNATQGSSLLQVADGALAEITDILQRQKSLAVQAGSGSLTDTERGFLDQEFQALASEIDRLSSSTTFNGVGLLNGSGLKANLASTDAIAATFDPTGADAQTAPTLIESTLAIEAFDTDANTAENDATALGGVEFFAADNATALANSEYLSVNQNVYGSLDNLRFENVNYTVSAEVVVEINGIEFRGTIADGEDTAVVQNGNTRIALGLTAAGSNFTNETTTALSQATIQEAFDDVTILRTANIDGIDFNGTRLQGVIGAAALGGIATVRLNSSATDVEIGNFQYVGGNGATSTLSVDINGEQFLASGVADGLAAGEIMVFENGKGEALILNFTGLDTDFDLGTDDNIRQDINVRNQFIDALNIGFSRGGSGLDFAIGEQASDSINVKIASVNTTFLYGGASLDLASASSAQTASAQIDFALDYVTGVRADVGAAQSRFNFASSNVQVGIQNQDAARAVFLDTDVATESTSFATSQVQLQAGISVLAQANLLSQNLLKLIG